MNLPVGTPCRFESGPVLDQSVGSPAAIPWRLDPLKQRSPLLAADWDEFLGRIRGNRGLWGVSLLGSLPLKAPSIPAIISSSPIAPTNRKPKQIQCLLGLFSCASTFCAFRCLTGHRMCRAMEAWVRREPLAARPGLCTPAGKSEPR